MIICAGDHGIIDEGVATSKKDITLIQANNMVRGVTGVCALSKQVGAEVVVVDLGIDAPDEERLPGIVNKNVMKGTNNFYREKSLKTMIKATMKANTANRPIKLPFFP